MVLNRHVAVYDQIAAIYDDTRGHEATALAELALGWLPTPATVVLDVGVGTGLTVPMLEEAGHRIVGVDVSAAMLARARVRCPTAAFLRADAVSLPFRRPSIDAAIALQVFQLVPEPAFLLAAIAAVLRPGGRLLAAPLAAAPSDPISQIYWDWTIAAGGYGTVDHFAAAGHASGFRSHRVITGPQRQATKTPNEEADRFEELWGGTVNGDAFRALAHPNDPIVLDATLHAVELTL